MLLSDYKIGDKVQVLTTDAKHLNPSWFDGEVINKQFVYPKHGERFNIYTMLIVRIVRTYCNTKPVYRWVGNIPVYVESTFEYFEKENDEGFVYDSEVRLKVGQ